MNYRNYRAAGSLALLLGLAACGLGEPSLGFDGLKGMHWQMTAREIETVLGQKLPAANGVPGSDCATQTLPAPYQGARLMMERGKLVRIDVLSGKLPSSEGVRIGDSESQLRAAYRHGLVKTPHKYIPEPEGRVLTVESSDGRSAIRFELERGKVRRYYAGVFPQVEYVEGCN